jgi:hypothetical protein
MAWVSTRKLLRSLLRSEFSVRPSVLTCASVAVLVCGSATVSPAIAQVGSRESALRLVNQMTAAIKACDYDEWAKAKSSYDYFVPRSRIEDRQGVPDAPSYPFPCIPSPRQLRTTNIRSQQEPAKLYWVGGNLKPAKLYSVGTPRSPGPVNWSGFYITPYATGNFNTLGQTERFKMTNVITNDFSDSSSAMGGGFVAGYLFAPWNNNFLVGLFGSVDFLNQNTNRTFPGGFFLGQNTNVIGTVGPQLGVAVTPEVLFFGEVGPAFVKLDQKLNFSGPVTSVSQTVTGVNIGVGVAVQPANWQVGGIPIAITVGYNHIFLPATTFDNPGSPLFLYSNQSDINQFKVGVRLVFDELTLSRQERSPLPADKHQY